MIDYSNLWNAFDLARGQTLDLDFGALRLWVHRGDRDWHFAQETISGSYEKLKFRVHDEPFEPHRDWARWILDEKVDRIQLRPMLPDRPLIVRPEMPMCLMPKQTVQFFVGIPIWLAVTFGMKQERVVEIPTLRLSNSWFGSFTEGELCYALKTTAKLHQQDLLPIAHRAIFPLEIRNASKEKLNFERLCLRPQFLNIFQGDTRLWTNKARVSYRGEDNWSRFVYAAGAPDFDQAGPLLGKAREALQRGAILKTFDNFKQRVEL